MKPGHVGIFVLITSVLVTALASTPSWAGDLEHSWSARFGDASIQEGYGTAIDGSGNVVLVASVQGTVDFGGGPVSSTSSYDIAIAKFDAAGNYLWSRIIPGVSIQHAYRVVVDRWNNIILTGMFYDNVDFGGGLLTSAGVIDVFVAKLDANGNHIWSRSFGDASNQYGASVGMDRAGNAVVVGFFQGAVDFGGGLLTSAGEYDMFVAKYDIGGNHMWSQRFGDGSNQYAEEVDIDNGGNIFITGDFYGAVDFGGGSLVSTGASDIFLVKFDSDGNHIWSRFFGNSSTQYVRGIAVDDEGDVAITGFGFGDVDFGGGLLSNAGGYDIYLAKFDSGGNHVWSQIFGDADYQQNTSAAVDAAGNVAIAGIFEGTVDFGGGTLNCVEGEDVYVARFDADGNHLWSQSFGDSADQRGGRVTVDSWGNFVLTGPFYGTLDFGGGPFTSAGNYDIYIARFWRLAPDIHAVRDVPGDQGGYVNLAFDASGVDNPGEHTITHYTVWRAIDQSFVSAALAGGATLVTEPPAAATIAPGQYVRVEETGNVTYYWENVQSLTAYYLTGYSATVPTLFDSTEVSTEYHYFQVIAHTSDPYTFYISETASGYSVDNLPPGMLMGLAGQQAVAPDGLDLTWLPNPEADLSHYVVHRGSAETFTPNPSTLIASPGEESAFDSEWLWDSGYYYKVAAVDEHGNVGPFALLVPEIVVSVGDDVPSLTYLGQNRPNPFNPTTTITFGLAEPGEVTLRIYDAGGRLVRTVADRHHEAGRHEAVWDGRDERGAPVASGVYFYRLTAPRFDRTNKTVLLK